MNPYPMRLRLATMLALYMAHWMESDIHCRACWSLSRDEVQRRAADCRPAIFIHATCESALFQTSHRARSQDLPIANRIHRLPLSNHEAPVATHHRKQFGPNRVATARVRRGPFLMPDCTSIPSVGENTLLRALKLSQTVARPHRVLINHPVLQQII